MTDTSPEMAALYRTLLLSRTGEERMKMGSDMFDFVRQVILSSLPPGLSELEIKRRLCERLYGKEVDVEAFIASLGKRAEG
jgi:hypothetical protein